MLEKFKEYLLLNGYSNQIYYQRIKKFLEKVKVEDISENTINQYILKQKENNAIETVNLDLKALKVYLKFLKKDITIPRQFKRIQKLPDSITLEYFEKEIVPVAECIFENPLRTKAILYFLLFSGLRRSEMLSVKRKDLDLEGRIGKIYIQKTKEERFVMFTKKVANLLKTYFITEPERDNAFNLGKTTVSSIFKKLKPHFPDIKLRPHLFRHCVSSDTQVLTNKGWNNYSNLKIKDKIMTYNLKTNQMEFSKLNCVYKYFINEKVYHLKFNAINSIFTKEHKLILQKRNYKQKGKTWDNPKLYTISEISSFPFKYFLSGKYNPNKRDNIGIHKAFILGILMADGCITKRKNPDVVIYQSISANKHKCKIIENHLNRAKLNFTIKDQKIQYNKWTGKNYQMRLFRILKNNTNWIFKWLDKNKNPKNNIYTLNKQELKYIFKGLILGDGTKQIKNSLSFRNQRTKYNELIQTISALLGYRTHLYKDIRGYYKVIICKRNNLQFNVLQNRLKEIQYKGIVWCPSTKNNTFLARRNNTVFLTGNSIATHLLAEGADITLVAKVLGHKNIASTMHYLRTDTKLMKKMYDKYVQ